MSESWNQGYLTEVGYTYGYYREVNPVFQRFCLLIRGFAPPAASASDVHCELGFGQGVSLAINAAASPGRYVGTDFNPAHAAHAHDLAGPSHDHLEIYDDSFEQLLAREDLPQFDSISLHGIWTWVSVENQALIVEFARRRLKAGGVLYISYNCFPGWAPNHPLRQLFAVYDRYGANPGAATARVEAALAFTEQMLAAKPGYLAVAPQVPARFSQIKKQNRNYLAHEYFNREWNCMYFTDVVERLAGAKLEFAATAVPLDMVPVVNLTAEAQQFLGGIPDPILREQARDYFVNQQFRRDLFMRGARALPPAEQRRRMLDQRFVLLTPEDETPLKVQAPLGEAALQASIYRPVIAALAAEGHRPKSLREVFAACPDVAPVQVEQAVIVLVAMTAAAPCQEEAAVQQVKARCEALNRRILERAIYAAEIEAMASPVIGGGVGVARFQQLFLLARRDGKKTPAEWAARVWEILQAQNQRIQKDGKALETPEENLAELTEQAKTFEKRLPVLKALMVI